MNKVGRRMFLLTIGTVLVGILLLLGAVAFSEQLLQLPKPKGLRILGLIAQPKDFLDYLVNEEFDLSKAGYVKRYKVWHKYAGNYDLGIVLRDPTREQLPKDALRVDLKVVCLIDGKVVMSRTLQNSRNYSPFLGQRGRGLHLTWYSCPEDLPLHKAVDCEVTVLQPDNDFTQKYGNARLFVQKGSDL